MGCSPRSSIRWLPGRWWQPASGPTCWRFLTMNPRTSTPGTSTTTTRTAPRPSPPSTAWRWWSRARLGPACACGARSGPPGWIRSCGSMPAPHASFEIQFGHVERPTHANTSWDQARFEVCAHRWADLSESGYGVALLNDSKYGYDVRGHTLRLSLLRSPTSPDPEADQGRHRFTYSLLPHRGGIEGGRVVEEGLALNMALEPTLADPHPGPLARAGSLVRVDRPGVVLDTLKQAEEGDELILRAYEAHGGRGPVRIEVGFPLSRAVRADLMEREIAPLALEPMEAGTALSTVLEPFEILTLKLTVTGAHRD